jgi:2-polyprenyl-3-methyl-5-hydroxy-6-metoxy-1,4-benzoquinol methylase
MSQTPHETGEAGDRPIARTVERQYQSHFELKAKRGLTELGVEKNASWQTDPRRLVFVLARYKFVAKMLAGKRRVLEIGCGDAFPARIVLQEVGELHAVDIDPLFIQDAQERADPDWPFTLAVHDILGGPAGDAFDAAFALDVIEHIDRANERRFLENVVASLTPDGVLIIGTPSLESQAYASPLSKIGHVNCKRGPELKDLMLSFFENVFMFSMNDEVVHTGFQPMAHYLFAIGAGTRRPRSP